LAKEKNDLPNWNIKLNINTMAKKEREKLDIL
jgi:hypothetical protein